MSKVEVKQHDITDCGATCSASIAAHYGLMVSIAKIRQVASTDKKGTTSSLKNTQQLHPIHFLSPR